MNNKLSIISYGFATVAGLCLIGGIVILSN